MEMRIKRFAELGRKEKVAKIGELKEQFKSYRSNKKENRRLIFFWKELEKYVNEQKITGELKEKILGLGDVVIRARENAAWILGNMGDSMAVPPLCGALKDSSPSIRKRAADSLGRLRDERAVMPLVDALKDPSNIEEIRARIAWALRESLNVKAAVPLARALRSMYSIAGRNSAQPPGKPRDIKVVRSLIGALKDEDSVVRGHSAAILEKTVREFVGKDPLLRKRVEIAKKTFGGIDDGKKAALLIAIALEKKGTWHGKNEAENIGYLRTLRNQAEKLSVGKVVEYLGL